MSVTKVKTKAGTRWRLRFYAGRDPDTGKREIVTKTFDRKKDADAEETRLKSQRDMGLLTTPSREPLGKYLRRWLRQVMRGKVRARTWSDYSGVLKRYIEDPPKGVIPVAKIRLDRLKPEALQALYSDLQERCGLSARTIRSLHAVVRQGLAYATKTGAIARNVATLVDLPRMERRKVEAMSRREAKAFLKAAESDRYHALWWVLLSGGLRPGEALGLVWDDLDLQAGRVHVQRALSRRGVKGWQLVEPKTSRGRRVVVLSDLASQALRDHRRRQAEERLLVGAEYEDNALVFATPLGKPLSGPNLYRRNYARICAEAELGEWREVEVRGEKTKTTKRRFFPAYRMYDLRHSAATLLLRAGVHPKAVSERLGHSSVAFTLDVYSASLPDLQEEAAEKLNALLR